MPSLLFVIALTAATGVGGLALGGVLALLLKRHSPRWSAVLLSFTAGLMLCIVSLDMVPESLEAAGSFWLTPLFLLLGFGLTWLLNCWIDKSAHHPEDPEDSEDHNCACGEHDLHTAGIILAAAVALHNVPVGMAVGSMVAVQGVCWAAVLAAVTIGLHNIPEGMSIAVPLLHDGSKAAAAIAVSALSGVPTVLGAMAGLFIGSQAPIALACALALAGGAMLYVVFFELLPEAYSAWRSKWAFVVPVIGFAVGVLLIVLGGHH